MGEKSYEKDRKEGRRKRQKRVGERERRGHEKEREEGRRKGEKRVGEREKRTEET